MGNAWLEVEAMTDAEMAKLDSLDEGLRINADAELIV